jgi:GNAT superfamily N-acetyltransferase
MPFTIRLLGAGDEGVLAKLAADEVSFDLDGRDPEPSRPLEPADAAAYLGDPAVLHWIAEDGERVIGFNLCYVLRRRSDASRELLLFEIGVHRDVRRQGVGRALIAAMREWMEQERVSLTWVLADNPGAEAFYAACGFVRDDEQGVQMLLTIEE